MKIFSNTETELKKALLIKKACSTFAKVCGKLTFLTPGYAHVRVLIRG